mgnify:CR=1 FL=1
MTTTLISNPFVGDVFITADRKQVATALRVDPFLSRYPDGSVVERFRVLVQPEGSHDERWTTVRSLVFTDKTYPDATSF